MPLIAKRICTNLFANSGKTPHRSRGKYGTHCSVGIWDEGDCYLDVVVVGKGAIVVVSFDLWWGDVRTLHTEWRALEDAPREEKIHTT